MAQKICYHIFRVIYGVDDDCRNNGMIEFPACDRAAAASDVLEAYSGIEILAVQDLGAA